MQLALSSEQPFRPATALQVLDNGTRRKLLHLLRSQGPLTAVQLADELEISNLKLQHHLRMLLELGLLTQVHRETETRYKFRLVAWMRLKKSWEGATHDQVGLARVR